MVGNYNEFPTGDKWPDEVQTAFENFVKNGGGFVSYHAADNAFPDWSDYNLMIGIGGWLGRNEKSGPYWYFKDGKLKSGYLCRVGPAITGRARRSWWSRATEAPDHEGSAREMDARRRRVVFEDARSRREHDRAGHRLQRSGQPRAPATTSPC